MRAERGLDRAVQVALTSTQRMRHGAVVMHGNRVLAVGVNSHRAHPLVVSDPKTDSAWHAEVAALRSLRTTVDYSRLTLYVARVLKNGTPANSRPCTRCMAVLDYLGITNIRWTEDEHG
jgi:tRNA(Arg) A34 adenosine deaminase TadA